MLEDSQVIELMQVVAAGQTKKAQALEGKIGKILADRREMNIAANRVSHIRDGGTP